MLRTILPLGLLLTAHCLTAQQNPEKLKGLLWEVSGNGIAKTGYLYGTMHVPEKLAFNLSDSFFVALRQSDVVALETDHDEWQAFTEILSEQEGELFGARYGEGGAFGQPANQPNLYATQFELSVPENPLLGAMLSAKPRMTNEFLYRSNQYRQDYEEDTYLDLFIFQAGRKLGKKVIGLETLEGSYEALVRAQLPDEEEENRDFYPGAFPPISMEDAYRDQDLTLLDSINRLMQPGKNFRRWMLDERNIIMANGIDSILQHGEGLLAAVGAAHLPGETGLIRLLQEKGYTLRPVQFSSDSSKQEKEAIEALRYPVIFSRQWASDSTWSVEAPGKFYQTVDGMGLEQQLCTDMSNGAYYAVYRVATYGQWNGQSAAYIADRIDSLIYEKIPGKIQERKRLSQPFPGHEILTRTRRGDILRYKIFATPMEVLLFAVGGNGDYAAGEEGLRFINSIQFHLPQTGGNLARPTVIQPEQGGFQVTLPAAPLINTTSFKDADRYLAATLDPADSSFYLVYRAVFHDWDYIEEDTFELNIIGEQIAEQFTKEPPQTTLVAAAPHPTQDIRFRSDRDSAWYYLRLVIDGPHYYLLGCRKTTEEAPTGFFNSFAIKPPAYPKGWETLNDTTLLFQASIPKASIKPVHPFVLKLKNIIEEGFQKNKRSGMYGMASSDRQTRVLELPLQGEQIAITVRAFLADGPAPTVDSFQSFVRKWITNNGDLAIRESIWENPDDHLLTGSFMLEDTNSVRGIRTKVFLTPGRLYALSATVHLGEPASAFVETLFDSFTPTDTTKGVLPFGLRNLQFLREIYAEDSLVREKALKRLESVWLNDYKPEDFQRVRAALDHPKFGELSFSCRKALLESLAYFENPAALRFIVDLNNRYPDSTRYQLVLLNVLSRIQTRESYEELFRRLRQPQQFVTKEVAAELLGNLRDSLSLTLRYLPDLIALSEWEDFREPVLDLLAEAVHHEGIKPRKYARLKPLLLRQTYLELGRLQFANEVKNSLTDDDRYLLGGYYTPYESENRLERNLRLLAPFLGQDKSVRELFARAASSSEKEFQVIAMSLLLQQEQPVRPKTLLAYAEDDRTRFMLYRHLADVGKLKPYSEWFTDTVALIRSILYEDMAKNSEVRGEPDSVRFISQHRSVQWRTPALLYFFDVKTKKDKEWRLAYVNVPLTNKVFAFQPNEDNDDVQSMDGAYRSPYWARPEVRILNDLPEKEKETYIRKKIGEIRFADRRRYDRYASQGRFDYYE